MAGDGQGPDFNPRSSCEERPDTTPLHTIYADISIHAPHARSDGDVAVNIRVPAYFNPRSSCEERLGYRPAVHQIVKFQSTLLMRGATNLADTADAESNISIHAPHARSDTASVYTAQIQKYFNPRSSCEERQCQF